ncbi:MAG: DMT family transporter [Hyphomicrobiaceae bacterium]
MARDGQVRGAVPYLLVTLAALCWAGNHVAGRAIAGHVPPLAISTIRWAIPTLILLPFAWRHVTRDWPAIRAHWRALVLLAAIGGGLFGALQYIGLQYTTAINVSVLNSLSPVLIAAAGATLFGDRLTAMQALGLATSLTGVLVVVTKGTPAALAALAFNWGDLIIILNMAIFGIYSTCLRIRPGMHWLSYTLILSVVSTLVSLPFMIWEQASGYVLSATPLTLAAIGYASIFPSLVANVAWNRGVEMLGPNRSGAMLHLVAVFSAVLSGVLLGERLETYHLVSFALIVGGVTLAAR